MFPNEPPQRDPEPMFAEDKGQPEVETQLEDDSQSKNNRGKEQATKKQYMETEYCAMPQITDHTTNNLVAPPIIQSVNACQFSCQSKWLQQ